MHPHLVQKIQAIVALIHSGRLDSALSNLNSLAYQYPKSFDLWLLHGTVSGMKGEHQTANASFLKAHRIQPNDVQAMFNVGKSYECLHDANEAISWFSKALALDAMHFDSRISRGVVHQSRDDIKAALDDFKKASELHPQRFEAFLNLGNLQVAEADFESALRSLKSANALCPESPETWNSLAHCHQVMGQFSEAENCARQGIARFSNHPQLLATLGNIFEVQEKYDEAIAMYQAHMVHVHSLRLNLAQCLAQLGRHVEALEQLNSLPKAEWGDEHFYAKGRIHFAMGNDAEAILNYREAVRLKPEHAAYHWNLAQALLKSGQFEEGWALHEWRWKRESNRPIRFEIAAPNWDGEALNGSLLLWGEQGIGDQLLFLTMLADVKSRVGKLMVAVDQRLLGLLRRASPQIEWMALDQTIEQLEVDAQLPIGSLGQFFRLKESDFPKKQPESLLPDVDRVAEFKKRISEQNPNSRLVIGVSWVSFRKDQYGPVKSLALEDLQAIFEIPNACVVDLQYGDTAQEINNFEQKTGHRLNRIDGLDLMQDMDGLAALMMACDVIVTVSNTTAHLAGALMRPTHLLLPEPNALIWYWKNSSDRCAWYPHIIRYPRLAYQEKGHQIQAVVDAIKNERDHR